MFITKDFNEKKIGGGERMSLWIALGRALPQGHTTKAKQKLKTDILVSVCTLIFQASA